MRGCTGLHNVHCFDKDILAAMRQSASVGELERTIYLAPSDYNDLVDFALPGTREAFASLTTQQVGYLFADVSGKGVPAALFMMRAKTQIRDYLESGMELGEAMENVNAKLCDANDAGMFATAWVGILDYATGHMDYVKAGHNLPLLWQDGTWSWLRQKSGLPLGLFDGLPYRTFSVDCSIGDELLVYTGGVTEAFSADEEQYGEERLEALVNKCFDLHPRELVDRVHASVAKHAEGAEQSDDITMLALEIGVPPEEKAQLVVPATLDALEQVNELLVDMKNYWLK